MKRYLMYKSIMKYLTDKDLSLNAKGFLSMILFNDEINALELSKYCSDDIETIKDTMLELRIMKYVKNHEVGGKVHFSGKVISENPKNQNI